MAKAKEDPARPHRSGWCGRCCLETRPRALARRVAANPDRIAIVLEVEESMPWPVLAAASAAVANAGAAGFAPGGPSADHERTVLYIAFVSFLHT